MFSRVSHEGERSTNWLKSSSLQGLTANKTSCVQRQWQQLWAVLFPQSDDVRRQSWSWPETLISSTTEENVWSPLFRLLVVLGVPHWCLNSSETCIIRKEATETLSSGPLDTRRGTPYSKQMGKMPDWDHLIVRCIANDLINKRMMGNQHGVCEELPVWQPSGYTGGWGWVGVGGLVS